ncbi:hypothetical protein GCM10028857_26300 [Salinarchaeum chitinilyticum]
MRRPAAVCLLALGLLLAPLAAAAAPGFAGPSGIVGSDAAGSQGAPAQSANGSISAGEQVAGAIGAEGASLDAEVSERSFGVKLAAAETNGSTAAVVAERLALIEQRLDALAATNESLTARADNGSITYGTYAARMAAVEAERSSLARQLNASQTVAEGLPADVLADNGVDAAAIDELRTRASELGGQQLRELAQSIAGPGVGNGFGPPGNSPGTIPGMGDGPPDAPGSGGNGSDPGDGAGGEPAGGSQDGNGTDGTEDDEQDGGQEDGETTEGSTGAGQGDGTDSAESTTSATND